MDNAHGPPWQPSISLDPASVNSHTHTHRGMPPSSRAGELMRRREPTGASSEDGTGSSRGRQRCTPADERSKEQAMWPNPWIRRHWDPEHPLNLNKPVHNDNAPLDSDELESRTFQPAFAMDLNDLVQSLWTPRPSPNMRPQGTTADMSRIRSQRSGSPPPPQPSLSSSYEMPSNVRDVRRQAPVYDDRRSVDKYEFRSRSRETTPPPSSADPRMSVDMDAWSRHHAARQPTQGREPWRHDEELRSRRAQPGPGYDDRDYPSSRRQPPQQTFERHDQHNQQWAHGMPPNNAHDRRCDDHYRGNSSEDNSLPRHARMPEYRESHSAGRQDPYRMDAREAAREAEAAAMARFSRDHFGGRGVDPRVDPRIGPELRRVVSEPPANMQRLDRRHEPLYNDQRNGQTPGPFLPAHPTPQRGGANQHQQQRMPTLTRAQSEGSLDDEEGYDV